VQVVGWALAIVSALLTIGATVRNWVKGPAEPPLDELTSRLATAMQVQWNRAARDRRLLEPAPLPIGWRQSVRALAGPPTAATVVTDGSAR
jgi:hypothetical protein